MKRTEGLRPWALYAFARSLAGVLRVFPVNANMVTARVVARVWWWLVPRHRQRARDHVRLAYGSGLTPQEVDRIAKESFGQLCMFGVDFVSLPHLVTEWNWSRYIRLRNMRDGLRVMLDGKGALLLTGHFGNWELAGYLLALFGFDITAIMRPLDNGYINRYVVATRGQTGLQLVDKKGAMDSAEAIIRRGGALGFIADQNAGNKGMFVDFFGVEASTYKSIALLAATMDVPIIVGYAQRLGKRFEFEVGVERIIEPREWHDRPDPLRWITQEYTKAIEASIRRAPEQYLWIHRRWKSRPRRRGEPRREAKGPQTASTAPTADVEHRHLDRVTPAD